LNGVRLTKSDFDLRVGAPGAFLLTVTYKDKYGPLGKIAAMLGTVNKKQIEIDFWVMSCRAFSRRIEHKCLDYVFDKFAVETVSLDFQPTDRNRPLQEFLTGLLKTRPLPRCKIGRKTFITNTPELHHTVKELAHA
jgi:predicted enzyme involved in methoxymalonyl-ACP biosynthesis